MPTLPLVRSLALIALVTVVAALTDYIGGNGQNCVSKDIGSKGDDIVEYSTGIPYGKSTKKFDKGNCRPEKWVGEQVTVCNKNNTTTDLPSIDGPPEGKLTPVYITCKDHDGCDLFYIYQCKGKLPLF